MAITTGYENEVNAKVTVTEFPILDFANNFSVVTETANQLVLADKTCPVDQIETVQFTKSDIPNIYKGTDIHPTLYSPVKSGKKVVISLRDVDREVNSVTGLNVDYPTTTSLSLSWANSASITADVVAKQVLRLVAFVVKAAQEDTSISLVNFADRLNEIMRGQAKPSEL